MAFYVNVKYNEDSRWTNIGIQDGYATRSEAYNRTQSSQASHSLTYAIFDEDTKIWEGQKGDPLDVSEVYKVYYAVPGYDRKRSKYATGEYESLRRALQELANVENKITGNRYDVMRNQAVIWSGTQNDAHEWLEKSHIPTYSNKENEMDLTSDLKPLSFKREDIIKSLQVKLDAEDAATKAVADERAASEKAFVEACAKLTPEQVVGLIKNYATSDVATITSWVEKNTFAPVEAVPAAQRETDLARAVRVLSLSSDETIELAPTNNIYNLL